MIFNFEDGKVNLLPEAMTLPEVKTLWREDKTSSKTTFNLIITYIYFVYRIDTIYKNMYLTTRKRATCVNQLGKSEDYWKDIEDKESVKLLIDWYTNNAKSKEEQLLDALDDDIDKYIEYLKNIPYTKKVRVEETKNDETGEVTTSYKNEDNSDEKMKAIKNSKDLLLYRKELKKLVKDTNAGKKKGKQFRTRRFEE